MFALSQHNQEKIRKYAPKQNIGLPPFPSIFAHNQKHLTVQKYWYLNVANYTTYTEKRTKLFQTQSTGNFKGI